jgi:polyhydroxyalkanoate synthesis regulator protein
MQGFMGRYLEQSVAGFVQQQQALQSQLTKMVSGTPLASVADIAQANLAMWQQMQETFAASLRPRAPEPAPEPEPEIAPKPAAGSTRRPRGGNSPRG